MRLPRRLLAALAVLVALPGCGGDTEAKNSYVDDVRTAQRNYVTQFDQIAKRLTATSSLAQDRAALRAFGTSTRRFVDALERVTPPTEVRDEHGRLVEAMLGYQRQVERGARRLREGSAESRAAVRTDLSSSITATQGQIAEAIGEINTALRG